MDVVLEFNDRWLRCGLVPALLSAGGRPQASARAPPALRLALSGGLCSAPHLQRRLAEELALALGALLARALLVDPRACRVLVCQPAHCPEAVRAAMAGALLRGVGVAAVAHAAAPACAALGCGAWTALVVALGECSVQVTPVVLGAPLAACAREWASGAGLLRALGVALALGAAAAAQGAASSCAASGAAAAAQPPPRRDPLAFAPSPFPGHPPSHPRAAALATPAAAPYGAACMPWQPGQRDCELLQGAQGSEALALAPALRGGERGSVWAALDAWCEAALTETQGRPGVEEEHLAVQLPPTLASALGCTVHSLRLPRRLWLAVCSGEALVQPWLMEEVHGAALAALAPLTGSSAAAGTGAAPHLCAAAATAACSLAAARALGPAPTSSLAEAVAGCLMDAPIDARRPLAQCLVVCGDGGSAPPSGFAAALLASVQEVVQRRQRGALRPLLPLLPHLHLGEAPFSLAPPATPAASAMDHCCASLLGGATLLEALVHSNQLSAVSSTSAMLAAPPAAVAAGAGGSRAGAGAPTAAARLALLSKGLQGGRGKA